MSDLAALAQTLQMALKALTMYTEAHPRSQEALQTLGSQVEAWLGRQPQLHLATSAGRLFVDGAPVEANTLHLTALQRQLSERQISGFVIQRGVQADELLAMLRLLILKPSRLEEQGGIAQVMAGLGLQHISLSQTQYREVRDGDTGNDPDPAPQAEPPTVSEIQRWQEALEALLRERQGLTPDLGFLAPVALGLGWSDAPPTPTQVEPLRSALATLPGDDQLAFLASLDQAPARPASLGMAFRMLAPEILGRVAGSLLGAGERANLGPLAHLLASDPSQWPAGLGAHLKEGTAGLQAWLEQMDWARQTLEEKLRRAMEEDALWNLTLEQRLAFLRELLEQGRTEAFLNLLDQVLRRLTLDDPALRAPAASTAAGIAPWIRDPGLPREGEGALIEALVAHFGWESIAGIHQTCRQTLGMVLGGLVARGELGFTLDLLRDLDGLCAFLEANQTWKREALQDIRSHLASPASLKEVVDACQRSDAPNPIQEILPFFEALGEPAARSLSELLAEEPDRKRRGLLMDLLRGLGSVAVPVLKEGLANPAWYAVRNTLNLLSELGDASLLEAIKGSLTHNDGRVRRAAVRALWKLGGPAAIPPLANLLPRTDPETQMEILFGFGQVHHSSALPALAELAQNAQAPLRLRTKAVETLGVLGDASALPILAEVLKRKGRIFTTSEPSELRIAAAHSLVALGSPESLQMLKAFADDEPRGGERDTFRALLERGR